NLHRDFLHVLLLHLHRLHRRASVLLHLLVVLLLVLRLLHLHPLLLHRKSGEGGGVGGGGGDGRIIGEGGESRWRGILLRLHRSGGDGGGGFLHPLFSSLHLLLCLIKTGAEPVYFNPNWDFWINLSFWNMAFMFDPSGFC